MEENEIKTLISMGCNANACVKATLNDAKINNYNVIVPKDCVLGNQSNLYGYRCAFDYYDHNFISPLEHTIVIEQMHELFSGINLHH